jgi:lysozyme
VKTSRTGIDLIKRFEGLELTAYKCSAGVWTVGYGHTSAAGMPKVEKGMKITVKEAEDILVRDLIKYEQAVTTAVNKLPTQNQFDAMVSLCFNIGPEAFAKSTLVRRFNEGDIAGAADAFLMWNKGGGKVLQGLVNRRKEEQALFLRAGVPVAPAKPSEPVSASHSPLAPKTQPTVSPETPETPAQSLAKWIMAAVGMALAALMAWMMKG